MRQRRAEAARRLYFTATARRPFYISPKKPDPPPKPPKQFVMRKIVHNPKCDPAPWMRPQPKKPEIRRNLEREKQEKDLIEQELRQVEQFYDDTKSSLSEIDDAEMRRTIKATVAMGEKEMKLLRRRLRQHRFDFKSAKRLRKMRKEEKYGDELVDKAQHAPDIGTGKLYLKEAEDHYIAAGAVDKINMLQRFWANRPVSSESEGSEQSDVLPITDGATKE